MGQVILWYQEYILCYDSYESFDINVGSDELGLDEVPAILLEDPVSGDPQVTVQNFFSELESSIKM